MEQKTFLQFFVDIFANFGFRMPKYCKTNGSR